MSNLDLRPLSLGELLDRTFSLYREHFLLFLGITAVPQLLILSLGLIQVLLPSVVKGRAPTSAVSAALFAFGIIVVGFIVFLVAYLFAQGATVFAVSEIYLGRTTTIRSCLERMRGKALNLLGVLMLNGLAVVGATLLLIVPGIYVACRSITCVPAALLEDLGAGESLSRSFELTKGNAGRSFVIYLLYFFLFYATLLLFVLPFTFAAGLSHDPGTKQMWLALSKVGSFFSNTLVTPFFTIATSVFYYDLRIRKEAFDLQLMMNPGGAIAPQGAGVPKMFG